MMKAFWHNANYFQGEARFTVQAAHKGVTLIELVVVLAIVGILAAYGVSNHRQAVVASQQNVGREFANNLILLQERYYTEAQTYTLDRATVGLPSPFESNPAYYSAVYENCPGETTASCVQVRATPTTHFGNDNSLVIVANTRSLWTETP